MAEEEDDVATGRTAADLGVGVFVEVEGVGSLVALRSSRAEPGGRGP